MNTSDFRDIVIRVFQQLQRVGMKVGVRELLDAIKLAQGEYAGHDAARLQQLIRLLWCRSPQEELQFDRRWSAAMAALAEKEQEVSRPSVSESWPDSEPAPAPSFPAPDMIAPQETSQRVVPEWSAYPVQSPFTPTITEQRFDLQSYWPVSRRAMAYAWRYLRRPLPDGPQDVLDLEATVEAAARQGFFLAPLYRRRERNHAHVLLLIDQNGSMTPLHRFTRDLVETALYESRLEQVDVVYFHNVPGEYLYGDPYLTQPVKQEQVTGQCSSETSVLIVSDAGAARGCRRLPRIQATTEALFPFKQRTGLIAWLNPMPQTRWPGTSAQIIAHLVPMCQMDQDGLSRAIDIVRG